MSSSNGNTEGTELGRFPRARRGRVRPEDAGLLLDLSAPPDGGDAAAAPDARLDERTA